MEMEMIEDDSTIRWRPRRRRRRRRRRRSITIPISAVVVSLSLFLAGSPSLLFGCDHHLLPIRTVLADDTILSTRKNNVISSRLDEHIIDQSSVSQQHQLQRLRRTQQQQQRPQQQQPGSSQTTTTTIINTNKCKKHSPTLHPGETLHRGEFLCHEELRFGIDVISGQFILGFYNVSSSSVVDDDGHYLNLFDADQDGNDSNNGNGSNSTMWNVGNATDSVNSFNSSNSSNFNPNSNNTNNKDIITPTLLAWTAKPTTLFIEPTRPFSYITLSDDGNILGYDVNNVEIYDSNYDYSIRLDSKEDNSILGLSNRCMFLDDVLGLVGENDEEGENGEDSSGNEIGDGSGNNTLRTRRTVVDKTKEGEMCVSLMSPAMPGMPYGMVTWGIMVHPEDIVEYMPEPEDETSATALMEVELTPSPIPSPVSTPTLRPTRRSSRRPSTPSTNGTGVDNTPSSTSPTMAQNTNLFQDSADPIISYESTSIIWGTVWLDSNRNGQMDAGETTISNFTVKLFECTSDTYRSNVVLDVARTDSEGMYFFQIPSGRIYRVQFDIDDDVYGYSSSTSSYENVQGDGSGSVDTHTNMFGWTSCERSSNLGPIQWNTGLYLLAEEPPPAMLSALPVGNNMSFNNDDKSSPPTQSPTERMASIGGFIYLDVDENGRMDSKERTAAVGGYTVNDAVIVVSLMDCQTQQVIATREVEFPGTYSFSNLAEGLYKLGYDMQGVIVSDSSSDNPMMPLYSFIGSGETFYETICGKLGKGEVIDSGNVGLRMVEEGNGGSGRSSESQNQLDEMEAMSSPDLTVAVRANMDGDDINEVGGGNNGNGIVPGIVGALITISIVVVASIFFIKHKRGTFPFLGGGGGSSNSKTDREEVRSVGPAALEDKSVVSATPSANQTAIGSLIVETSKSVAAMTTGGESGGPTSDDESDDYTGMEFALKGSALGAVGSVGGGNSPYQSQFSPSSEGSNNGNRIPHHAQEEDGSEGYEVYDDEEDEENGHAPYGPVISDMIAKYSKKQGDHIEEGMGGIDAEQSDSHQVQEQSQNYPDDDPNGYPSQQDQHDMQGYNRASHHDPQSYSQQHHQVQQENQDWRRYQVHDDFESSGEELAIVQSDNNQVEGGGQDYQYQGDYQQGGGYYPNNAYDASQNQYQYNNNEYGEQLDDQVSLSESSRTSDPPAASYRDIPASNAHAGWDDGHQVTQDHHYDASYQYAHNNATYAPNNGTYAHNDATYAENYESTQFMTNDEGAYDGEAYDHNNNWQTQKMRNILNDTPQYDDGAYAENYYDANDYDANDNGEGAHESTYNGQQIESDSESSDSESSEEASASGWSSSSSTTNESSRNGGGSSSFNWNRAANKAKARRAQSNPRDNRHLASWRDQAAIPENSTVEYNPYEASNSYNYEGGFAHAPVVDDKSVISTGSDLSSDPPGASYKNLAPPPPPRRFTPPRRSPPRTTPPTTRRFSPLNDDRRGSSVPPPPPRAYPSPPR